MRAWWWVSAVLVATGCGSADGGAKPAANTADTAGDSSLDSKGDAAVDVANPATPSGVWANVSTSDGHACAVTDLGWVACWGANAEGELGDGTTQSRMEPRFIGGMGPIATVTTSPGNTCAQAADGALWCWGHAMATVGVEDPTRPWALIPPKPAVQVAMSDYTVCALFDDGTVGCAFSSFVGGIKWIELAGVKGAKAMGIGDDLYWLNKDGKLQAGGFDDSVPPKQLSSQVLVDLKVEGAAVVGLDAKGQVWLIGDHDLAPPPAGCDASRCEKLTALPGATEIVDLSTSCGRRADGSAVCWRYLPSSWQGGAATKASAAKVVEGVSGAVKLRSSYNSFAALGTSGELRVWGHLTGASAGTQWQPAAVAGVSSAATLIGGSAGACALDAAGTPTCWGARPTLPDQLPIFADVATAFGGLPKATKLGYHSAALCGVGSDGSVVCRGLSAPADAGLKIPDRDCLTQACSVPEAGSGITDVRAAATGGSRWCAVDSAGTLRCWGDPTGHVADLGTGSTVTDTVWPPVSNPSLPPVQTSCFTGGFGCALTKTGKVWCWGERANWGTSGTAPAEVPGVADATLLRCHLGGACVVTGAGGVTCWGSHMGKGDVEPLAATAVAGLPPVQALAMGGAADGERFCAIAKDGQVWCWGQGDDGQLGLGAKVKTALKPQALPGLNNAVAIVGGVQVMCAALATGQVQCWGTQLQGELGNGAPPMVAPTLVAVPGGK